jgi:hypothetical protein
MHFKENPFNANRVTAEKLIGFSRKVVFFCIDVSDIFRKCVEFTLGEMCAFLTNRIMGAKVWPKLKFGLHVK